MAMLSGADATHSRLKGDKEETRVDGRSSGGEDKGDGREPPCIMCNYLSY